LRAFTAFLIYWGKARDRGIGTGTVERPMPCLTPSQDYGRAVV